MIDGFELIINEMIIQERKLNKGTEPDSFEYLSSMIVVAKTESELEIKTIKDCLTLFRSNNSLWDKLDKYWDRLNGL